MATLTVTITEAVTLNGVDRGVTNTLTAAVTEVDHRILDITTGYIDYIRFGSANGAGQYKDATIAYIRITNLDVSADVILRLRGNGYTSYMKVPAKGSCLLTDQTMDAFANITSADSLANLDSIAAKTSSAPSQIEMLVAVA